MANYSTLRIRKVYLWIKSKYMHYSKDDSPKEKKKKAEIETEYQVIESCKKKFLWNYCCGACTAVQPTPALQGRFWHMADK